MWEDSCRWDKLTAYRTPGLHQKDGLNGGVHGTLPR